MPCCASTPVGGVETIEENGKLVLRITITQCFEPPDSKSSANRKELLDQPIKTGLTLEKVVTVSAYRPRKRPRLWIGADGEVLFTSVPASTIVAQSAEQSQESVG